MKTTKATKQAKTRSRTATRKPRSTALAAVHETVAGLHTHGLVDKETMRKFDTLCLSPVHTFKPAEIAALRRREGVSQPVFAAYLNVAKTSVSKWERGENKPDGSALKLLTLVKKKGLKAIA